MPCAPGMSCLCSRSVSFRAGLFDLLQKSIALRPRRDSHTYEVSVREQPHVGEQAGRVLVEMKERFRSNVEDTPAFFPKGGQPAELDQHRLQTIERLCAGVLHGLDHARSAAKTARDGAGRDWPLGSDLRSGRALRNQAIQTGLMHLGLAPRGDRHPEVALGQGTARVADMSDPDRVRLSTHLGIGPDSDRGGRMRTRATGLDARVS